MGRSDVADGWREHRAGGGLLIGNLLPKLPKPRARGGECRSDWGEKIPPNFLLCPERGGWHGVAEGLPAKRPGVLKRPWTGSQFSVSTTRYRALYWCGRTAGRPVCRRNATERRRRDGTPGPREGKGGVYPVGLTTDVQWDEILEMPVGDETRAGGALVRVGGRDRLKNPSAPPDSGVGAMCVLRPPR